MQFNITESGKYEFDTKYFSSSSLYFKGSFGGATVTIEHNDLVIADGTVEENTNYLLQQHGQGIKLTVNVVGGTDIDFTAHIYGS